MIKRTLIINIDDFGLCASTNNAVKEILNNGIVKSASVMTVCPASQDAIEYASKKTDVTFGIHIVNTSEWENCRWKPLTDGNSLVDDNGFMWKTSDDFARAVDFHDLKKEINKQTDMLINNGIEISHLDTHMGALYGCFGRPSLLPFTFSYCNNRGFALRIITKYLKSQCPDYLSKTVFRYAVLGSKIFSVLFRVKTPDYMVNPYLVNGYSDYASFRELYIEYLSNIPNGITEIYLHPSLPGNDIKTICPDWERRYFEYQLLTDNLFFESLKNNGIIISDYSCITN